MGPRDYGITVFINCPFDQEYRKLRNAMVFAIFDCGFVPSCALAENDGGDIRFEKIARLIGSAQYGIHDISCVELGEENGLPRFNMPLELGLFLGAKRYGNKDQKKKNALILEREPYRYQQFMSDIAGQDIRVHGGDEQILVSQVRDWLADASRRVLPGGNDIGVRYRRFSAELPALCTAARISVDEITFNDYCIFVSEWLRVDSPG